MPLAVGFGVRTPEHAVAIGEIADGVVMASELIRLGDAAGGPEAAVAAIGGLAGQVRAALAADATPV